MIRSLRGAHIPLVQLSRRIGACADFVGIDDRAAASEMMEHVVGHGYRDIVTIVEPRTSSASAAREDGFVRTADRWHHIASHHISTYLGGSHGGYVAVRKQVLARRTMPHVIVCGVSAIALAPSARYARTRSQRARGRCCDGHERTLFPGASPLVEGYHRQSARANGRAVNRTPDPKS